MSEQRMVIYTAGSSQQAHFLKNLLAQSGIRAVVENDLLERGSGVDFVGWATSARVVVAERDVPRALQIAMEFDRRTAATATGPAVEEPTPEPTPAAPWPTCPQCHRRRSTRCKICGTAGTDFDPVDMGFVWTAEMNDMAAAGSCSCGPGGCGAQGSTAEGGTAEGIAVGGASAEPDAADGPHSTEGMLMCPTCDEPFVPEYPRQCEWCGHEFDDGYEVPQPTGTPEEASGSKVYLVVVGLLALLIASVAYFLIIL